MMASSSHKCDGRMKRTKLTRGVEYEVLKKSSGKTYRGVCVVLVACISTKAGGARWGCEL